MGVCKRDFMVKHMLTKKCNRREKNLIVHHRFRVEIFVKLVCMFLACLCGFPSKVLRFPPAAKWMYPTYCLNLAEIGFG